MPLTEAMKLPIKKAHFHIWDTFPHVVDHGCPGDSSQIIQATAIILRC